MCFPLFFEFSNAQLSDSVPPEVKKIFSGLAFIKSAMFFLVSSISSLDIFEKAYTPDGLEYTSFI